MLLSAMVAVVAAAATARPVASIVPGLTAPTLPQLPVPLPPLPVPLPPLPVPLPLPGPTPPVEAPAGVEAYRGLGTWVDVFDWSLAYTNGRPATTPDDVDRMAALGVRTLYIQAARHDGPDGVLEPERLRGFLDRAAARGMNVVPWYLPSLVDPGRDLQRLKAIAALPHVDAIGVDIESRDVADPGERSRRLVSLSSSLRRELPGRTIGAIVLPAVVLDVVNTRYWPGFPYRELAGSYDVWLPMSYWTNRTSASGYRDAYRYTRENVDRLRAHLGRPDALVHPIGGIGDRTDAGDVDGYRRAVSDTGGIGTSLYDWRTTGAQLWHHLR
ncbi:MAG TPA: hypothetical protein VHE80_09625 [Acidimicrobiales bacterium]|nr:hypothetical protein [Acidimicrobiales bacterium]